MDTKLPEPDCATGNGTCFVMGKERDVFLSAKSRMKMAEGEDEIAWRIQSPFASRWWRSKAMQKWNLHMCRTEA